VAYPKNKIKPHKASVINFLAFDGTNLLISQTSAMVATATAIVILSRKNPLYI